MPERWYLAQVWTSCGSFLLMLVQTRALRQEPPNALMQLANRVWSRKPLYLFTQCTKKPMSTQKDTKISRQEPSLFVDATASLVRLSQAASESNTHTDWVKAGRGRLWGELLSLWFAVSKRHCHTVHRECIGFRYKPLKIVRWVHWKGQAVTDCLIKHKASSHKSAAVFVKCQIRSFWLRFALETVYNYSQVNWNDYMLTIGSF